MFLKKFKNVFCLRQTKNVGRAVFLDEAKRSNILLDKQISNVGPTMFDCFATAFRQVQHATNSAYAIASFVKHMKFACQSNVLSFGLVAKQCLSKVFCLRQPKNVFKHFQKHQTLNADIYGYEAMF